MFRRLLENKVFNIVVTDSEPQLAIRWVTPKRSVQHAKLRSVTRTSLPKDYHQEAYRLAAEKRFSKSHLLSTSYKPLSDLPRHQLRRIRHVYIVMTRSSAWVYHKNLADTAVELRAGMKKVLQTMLPLSTKVGDKKSKTKKHDGAGCLQTMELVLYPIRVGESTISRHPQLVWLLRRVLDEEANSRDFEYSLKILGAVYRRYNNAEKGEADRFFSELTINYRAGLEDLAVNPGNSPDEPGS